MTFRFGRALLFSSILLGILQLRAQVSPQPAASDMIKLRSVEAKEVASPKYAAEVRGESLKRDGRLEWLMVKAVWDTIPRWTDEVTFTFYVALKGNAADLPQGAAEVNLFSGTVTLVNVPQSKQGETTMFLDPYTLARYGEVQAVAVVINVNGQTAAGMAEPKSSEASQWWTRETPNETPLLTRDKTPYALIEVDKQNTIKN